MSSAIDDEFAELTETANPGRTRRNHPADGHARRRLTAARSEPLPNGTRDPWSPNGYQRKPSTFSLSLDELRKYANELVAAGWDIRDVRQVIAVPHRHTCSCPDEPA